MGAAKATITGLARGATADSIELDGEVIRIYANALGTGKVTLKGD